MYVCMYVCILSYFILFFYLYNSDGLKKTKKDTICKQKEFHKLISGKKNSIKKKNYPNDSR